MKITDSEELGNIIRNRRKELKYTQAFLSEYTGLSVSFISDVERGKTTVEIGKVMQLISILGLDINKENIIYDNNIFQSVDKVLYSFLFWKNGI